MKTKFLETKENYDGSQLVSLRNYLKHGLLGDSIVAWTGPCNVTTDHMIDGEDLVAGAEIRGANMLHFIIEIFDSTLLAAVSTQRLLAAIIKDELTVTSGNKAIAQSLTRDGDDLYANKKKLSISIATQSPVSSLIHFALNIENKNTPVETLSLEDLQVDPKPFAEKILQKFSTEFESIRTATKKVRWAK